MMGSGRTAYYVSLSGDNSNPGTIDQPWKTFERAFDFTQSRYLHGGETLYIRGGTYHFNPERFSQNGFYLINDQISGTPGQPTIISSYPGERATINVSVRMDSGWQPYAGRQGANVWYVNWGDYVRQHYPSQWQYNYGQSESQYWKFVPQLMALDGTVPILLQQVNAHKNGYLWDASPGVVFQESVRTNQDDMIAGDFYYESDQTKPNYGMLYVCLNHSSHHSHRSSPNGRPLEVGLSSMSFGSQHDVTISNISVRYGNIDGLVIGGRAVTLDGLDLSYNGLAGLGGTCASCVINNSILSHNGNNGGGLIGEGTIYQDNTIEANNYRHYNNQWHAGGMKFIPNVADMVIRHNTFKNNISCIGLWLDSMYGGHIIEGNTFITDPASGIGGVDSPVFDVMIEGNQQASADKPTIIRNNIFGAGGVYISVSQYVYVYNNVFNMGGVYVDGLAPGRPGVSNNQIYNNIFYNSPQPIYIVRNPPPPLQAVNNVSDYNLFFNSSGASPQFISLNLSGWQAAGFDTHSIVADPLLGDPATGNFVPGVGSPVTGAGLVSSNVISDILGNPRTGRNDIGPYQLAVQTSPAAGAVISGSRAAVAP